MPNGSNINQINLADFGMYNIQTDYKKGAGKEETILDSHTIFKHLKYKCLFQNQILGFLRFLFQLKNKI